MYVGDSDEDELDWGASLNGEDSERMGQLSEELRDVEKQIKDLKSLRQHINDKISAIRIKAIKENFKPADKSSKTPSSSAATVDYTTSTFPWSADIKQTAKQVWNISSFRHSQEAVINAAMDKRDVLCLLPTGAGKSLCFQLPAILSEGTTLVITPLISLMQDQVFNLQRARVKAAMLHASTGKDDVKDITNSMIGKNVGQTLKLVYVTPERVDKSKSFINTLQKMYDKGSLTRIVIDEAHCVSSLGHDYRPAYLALSKLRSLFPRVPIIALTATATGKVIQDMLRIIGMPTRTSPPDAALPSTTVVLTSPLYRPNLHYRIVPKPSKAEDVMTAIVDYITSASLENHGLTLCKSRNDTEAVAKGILQQSKGSIKTAVYHAYIDDAEKVRIHEQWRAKRINVVVATNASFGLGIDAPDVRFVIHHTMAKNIESFYQESGRAGRDGLDADCLTYYRAGDASKLSTLIYETFAKGAGQKLYDMVRMAEDVRTCRNIAFSRYFKSAQISQSFTSTDDEKPCGHCDNCKRDPQEITSVDVSLEAYRALKILSAANQERATLTLKQAVDLVRGLGGGKFSTMATNGSKGAGSMNVNEVAGSKVQLNADMAECLLVRLLIDGYLRESFHATAYNVLSYIQVTSLAARFTRKSPEQVDQEGAPVKIELETLRKVGKASKAKAKTNTKKRKQEQVILDDDTDEQERLTEDANDEHEQDEYEMMIAYGNGDMGSDTLDDEGWQTYEPQQKKKKV